MKTIRRILPLLLILAFSFPAFAAGKFKTSLWGAYGIVSMTDANKYIIDSFGVLTSSYTVKGASYGEINYSSQIGFDAGYEFLPGIILGARLSQIRCSKGNISGAIVRNPQTGETADYKTTFDSSLVPLMVGGSYTWQSSDRISVSAAIYAGYALASAKFNHHDNLGGIGSDYEIPLDGSGITDDFSGEIQYKIRDFVSVGLNVHLMSAKISEMKVAKDITDLNIEQGTVFTGQSNNTLILDFSGIAFGISLNVFF